MTTTATVILMRKTMMMMMVMSMRIMVVMMRMMVVKQKWSLCRRSIKKFCFVVFPFKLFVFFLLLNFCYMAFKPKCLQAKDYLLPKPKRDCKSSTMSSIGMMTGKHMEEVWSTKSSKVFDFGFERKCLLYLIKMIMICFVIKM